MKLAAVVFSLAIVAVSSFSVPSQKIHAILHLKALNDGMEDTDSTSDRRSFLTSGMAASLALILPVSDIEAVPALKTRANAATTTDYKKVAADIQALVEKTPDLGPTLVRLAWHSSGTYDKMSKTGGSSKGTIRFKKELDYEANAGLDKVVKILEPVHQKYADSGLSYADLYTLAGVAAIREMKGPTIPWSNGRVDTMDPSDVPPDKRLPSADSGRDGADRMDAQHLREIFGRMGFGDREIVVLSGAHSLGRCNLENSGYDGTWTSNPTRVTNLYYNFLLGTAWFPERTAKDKLQYRSPVGGFMMLPTDLILKRDWRFRFWVWFYAKRPFSWQKDFAKAFQKLEELGTKNLTPTEWA